MSNKIQMGNISSLLTTCPRQRFPVLLLMGNFTSRVSSPCDLSSNPQAFLMTSSWLYYLQKMGNKNNQLIAENHSCCGYWDRSRGYSRGSLFFNMALFGNMFFFALSSYFFNSSPKPGDRYTTQKIRLTLWLLQKRNWQCAHYRI